MGRNDRGVVSLPPQGFFMQNDYKMFPPSVDWDNVQWNTRRPIMDYPVQVRQRCDCKQGGSSSSPSPRSHSALLQSAICAPLEGEAVVAGAEVWDHNGFNLGGWDAGLVSCLRVTHSGVCGVADGGSRVCSVGRRSRHRAGGRVCERGRALGGGGAAAASEGEGVCGRRGGRTGEVGVGALGASHGSASPVSDCGESGEKEGASGEL